MKKVGLLGGMGPESTIAYYHDIVFGVQAKTGKQFFPDLSIESLNLFEIVKLCREKQYDKLVVLFKKAVERLAATGADFAVLTANTSHIVFDQLKESSPLPLLSIVDATRDEAERRGIKRLGLLGTCFTMEEAFFKKPFREHGIEIVVPSKPEIDYISDKIYSELEFGVVKDSTRQRFQKIIAEMRARDGIEAVILGCTELPLILNDDNSPVPCLDTMKIHVQRIIETILC
ncbi:MAG: amino acid racemase [Muribaculaceae bacterium]|nr:amino acid racemase [Muribaculaceae bacterium]